MTNNNRRHFLKSGIAPAALALAADASGFEPQRTDPGKPNVLFLMADQFRFDAIATLGNSHIYTPNIDRLVRRGRHLHERLLALPGMCARPICNPHGL